MRRIRAWSPFWRILAGALLCASGSWTCSGYGSGAAPGRSVSAGPRSVSAAPPVAPERFAEGVITTGDYEYFTTFTPDGATLYFGRANPGFSYWTILQSHLQRGRWSAPRVAPFSGRWSDADPRVSPDGSRLFFLSNRPLHAGGQPKADLDLWVMDRTADAWSEPRHLGTRVNGDHPEWSPSVTGDGTLYFGTTRQGGHGAGDIWMSKLVDGDYTEPVNLGDSVNTEFSEVDPYVAPDGSWLVFGAAGRPDGLGDIDLYVSLNRAGVWSKARHLEGGINSPATDFSPGASADGREFFFTSARGVFDAPPERPRTTEELERALRGLGNGLGDLYHVDVRALGVEPPGR